MTGTITSEISMGLRQAFSHGVGIVPPHSGSTGGNVFHNRKLKKRLLRDGINNYVINLGREHVGFESGLAFLEVDRTSMIPEGEREPDDTFVCDSLMVAGELIVTPRMGAKNRRPESSSLANVFVRHFPNAKIISFTKPSKLEPGDMIPLHFGKYVALLLGRRPKGRTPGLCVRTNSHGRADAIRLYKELYGKFFLGAVIAEHSALHVGTTTEVGQVAHDEPLILAHNHHLLEPKKVRNQLRDLLSELPTDLQPQVITHKVRKEESWGAPFLSNGCRALIQKGMPYFNSWLRSKGFTLHECDFEYHQGLDGNMRCKVQPKPRILAT